MRLQQEKMKAERSDDQVEEAIADLGRHVNDLSLESSEKKAKERDDTEVETVSEVEAVIEALNDLSVGPRTPERDDERIERGPVDKNQPKNRPSPYNMHLSGGSVIEVAKPATIRPPAYSAAICLAQGQAYVPPASPSEVLRELYSEGDILDVIQDLVSKNEMGQKMLIGVVSQQSQAEEYDALIETLLDWDTASSPSTGTTSIPICSPPTNSPTSSGYESGTSSPSHSPPRAEESFVPESIQLVNSQKGFRTILPKLELTTSIQREFFEYIHTLGGDREGNEVIFKKTEQIYYINNSLDKLVAPMANGDTILMICVANENATKQLASRFGYNKTQETVFRLSSIFNLVKRFHTESPKALEAKNDLKQSVLHLAARNCYEHPLVAAYIAEKLQLHNYNFNEACSAEHCEMQGAGNLLHCLAQKGDSHAAVLHRLLSIKALQDLLETTCLQRQQNLLLTPLHVAIVAQNFDAIPALSTAKHLIQHGAKLSKYRCRNVNSALHHALSGTPSYEMVDLVLSGNNGELRNSPESNVPDLEGQHPLLNLASASGKLKEADFLKLLHLLVSKGATIKKVDDAHQGEFFTQLNKNLSPASVAKARNMLNI